MNIMKNWNGSKIVAILNHSQWILAKEHYRYAQDTHDQRNQISDGTPGGLSAGMRYVDSVGMMKSIMAMSGPLIA